MEMEAVAASLSPSTGVIGTLEMDTGFSHLALTFDWGYLGQ